MYFLIQCRIGQISAQSQKGADHAGDKDMERGSFRRSRELSELRTHKDYSREHNSCKQRAAFQLSPASDALGICFFYISPQIQSTQMKGEFLKTYMCPKSLIQYAVPEKYGHVPSTAARRIKGAVVPSLIFFNLFWVKFSLQYSIIPGHTKQYSSYYRSHVMSIYIIRTGSFYFKPHLVGHANVCLVTKSCTDCKHITVRMDFIPKRCKDRFENFGINMFICNRCRKSIRSLF